MDKRKFLSDVQLTNPGWVASNDAIGNVALTTSIAPLCLLFREAVYRICGIKKNGGISQFLMDYFSISVPIIFAFTVTSDHELAFHTGILLISGIIISMKISAKSFNLPDKDDEYPLFDLRPYLNTYRCYVNLCTINSPPMYVGVSLLIRMPTLGTA